MILSGCGTIASRLRAIALRGTSGLETVAEAGAHLDLDGRVADRLVVALQVEHHAIHAGAEHVLDGIAALDLGLTRFVRRAVAGRLGFGAVAPFPLDGAAVEILEVVGATVELSG